MKVMCPYCNKGYILDDKYIGRKGRCNDCGKVIELVPGIEVEGTKDFQAEPASRKSIMRNILAVFTLLLILITPLLLYWCRTVYGSVSMLLIYANIILGGMYLVVNLFFRQEGVRFLDVVLHRWEDELLTPLGYNIWRISSIVVGIFLIIWFFLISFHKGIVS